jgi:hypothetical protein
MHDVSENLAAPISKSTLIMKSLWKVGVLLPDYTMSYPRNLKCLFNILQLQTFWHRFISVFVADFRFIKLSVCLETRCSFANIYYYMFPFVSQCIATLHFNIISTFLFLRISPWLKGVHLRNRDGGTCALIMLWAGPYYSIPGWWSEKIVRCLIAPNVKERSLTSAYFSGYVVMIQCDVGRNML